MEEFEKFYNKALKFLSYRPRSEKEVRDNLRWFNIKKNKKTVTTEVLKQAEAKKEKLSASVVARETSVIDQVINKLKEQKFLNDEEFVRWWVEQRATFRPKGMRLIKMELKQKGIPNEIVESQIYNFQFLISNKETIKRLIEKRINRYKNLSFQEIKQKLMRYLSSKGFEYEDIKQAIDDIVKEGV